MENQQPPEHKNNMKRWLPYLLVGVFAIVALVSLYFAYQTNMKSKTTPPEYKKVSAVTGTDIPVSVESDGVSIYFEHNGERLSLTNRITDLMVGTEYTFTFTNNSGAKQGVFIPALKESVVVDTTQTVSISIKFDNPGTYYFMGNVYQPGWEGLKSGLDVGMDAIETQPPTQSTPTATVTPTPTEPPGTTFNCANVSEIPQIECEALVGLYNSTSGPTWTNHARWLQTNTPCNWATIICNSATPRHVVQILNSGNNLRGNIPSNIENLANLQYLILDDNQLSGSIPTSIGNLTNLLILRVWNNQLSGSIPTSIGNLINLTQLSLHDNQLSGVIPSTLNSLIHMSGLNVSFENNMLTGIENQTVCPWLAEHTSDEWWTTQIPPISYDPCQEIAAQPVAARNSGIARPTTMPLPTPNIFDRITLFFQQLLQNVFGK